MIQPRFNFLISILASCLEETKHHSSPSGEELWRRHHVGFYFVCFVRFVFWVFFAAAPRTGRKLKRAKYRDIINENLVKSTQDLNRLRIRLRKNSVIVLEWPSQNPDRNPFKHLRRDLKMAFQQQPHVLNGSLMCFYSFSFPYVLLGTVWIL